jgi:hypothetical protein
MAYLLRQHGLLENSRERCRFLMDMMDLNEQLMDLETNLVRLFKPK